MCRNLSPKGPFARNATVHYAQSLGFAPHRDFRPARLLLAGIDPSLCPDELEFGKDGKPLYIQGPNESLDQVRLITSSISARDGHYLIGSDGPVPAMIGFDDDDDVESDEDVGGEFDEVEEAEAPQATLAIRYDEGSGRSAESSRS